MRELKTQTTSPELTPERLKELVAELRKNGALSGTVVSRDDESPKGLAFIVRDLTSVELQKLLPQIDLTIPLSRSSLETLRSLKEMTGRLRRLEELAVQDTLTGLYNFRHFRQRLSVELERVRRTENPCSLIMIDLDRFKPVNDEYGHQTGDELLRQVADIIQASIRTVDVPIRYGGDEFAVILPDTDTRAAERIARRIRENVEKDPRTAQYGVTGSFGLATHRYFDDESEEALVERADQAMYRAKSEGGNKVWTAEQEARPEAPTAVSAPERDALYIQLARMKDQ